MCGFLIAKDLAVVVAVAIMRTEREVGIKKEAHAIETAAEKGDDKYIPIKLHKSCTVYVAI